MENALEKCNFFSFFLLDNVIFTIFPAGIKQNTGCQGTGDDTHLTFTPKLKNRYHPLVAILFVLFG